MNKKEILQLTNDLKFISGIYNYCDRWCERCPFTSRCLNYAMTEKIVEDSSSRDQSNKLFWEEMQALFEQTSEMITEMAEERGIDLDSIDTYFASGEIERKIDEAKNHYLAQAAREYSRKVNEWFEIESSSGSLQRAQLHVGNDSSMPEPSRLPCQTVGCFKSESANPARRRRISVCKIIKHCTY